MFKKKINRQKDNGDLSHRLKHKTIQWDLFWIQLQRVGIRDRMFLLGRSSGLKKESAI